MNIDYREKTLENVSELYGYRFELVNARFCHITESNVEDLLMDGKKMAACYIDSKVDIDVLSSDSDYSKYGNLGTKN